MQPLCLHSEFAEHHVTIKSAHMVVLRSLSLVPSCSAHVTLLGNENPWGSAQFSSALGSLKHWTPLSPI
eukprot:2511951-Amphidinium_carterae.1